MLYDMTSGTLNQVLSTTFKAENVLERTHLQAAIRDRIDVVGGDLLVVAEEFGDFEDTNRRIDLLCVERSGRLVVVELKRTEDGGHMELQALRYAAMVSVMTFDDLVRTYSKHLEAIGDADHGPDDARTRLVDWLDDADGDEPVISREVSIVLAAADFSQEITTTVLWLNEFYGMDIRCIRLSPYRHAERLLLDVQQVIPLPEAAELTIRLKRREAAAKKAKEGGRDYTKYIVIGPEGSSGALAKRHAMSVMVHAVHEQGIGCEEISSVLPASKFRSIALTDDAEELWPAMVAELHLRPNQADRWHIAAPIHENDRTWVLHSNWGTRTGEFLDALSQLTDGVVRAEAANSQGAD